MPRFTLTSPTYTPCASSWNEAKNLHTTTCDLQTLLDKSAQNDMDELKDPADC